MAPIRIVWRPIESWHGEHTKQRRESPFRSTQAQTERLLRDEVWHLVTPARSHQGEVECIVQLGLTEWDFTVAGKPRANARDPQHPGVVVQFDPGDGPLRFQADAFYKWEHNLRAVALGMEALRKIRRYGMGTGSEQYRGFRAIGVESMPMTSMSPETAAGILIEFGGPMAAGYEPSDVVGDREVIAIVWKLAHRLHHPDLVGGDPDTAKKINVAHDVLVRSLDGPVA